MPNQPVRVWLDLPPELDTALRAAGRQEHLSRDEAIRRACEEYVARRTVDQNHARDEKDVWVHEGPVIPGRLSRGIAEMALVREPAR